MYTSKYILLPFKFLIFLPLKLAEVNTASAIEKFYTFLSPYRLLTCHFVRKCFDNLKKAAVQYPSRKHCVRVLFNEIAEINSKFLVKKGLHQEDLLVNILEIPALLQEGLT